MIKEKNAVFINNTALKISVYSVRRTPAELHEAGIVELIFCLQGEVVFDYEYEKFTLKTGDFILVDRDAYYMYQGKNCICMSLYIDMNRYEKIHPGISRRFFICEGIAPYNGRGSAEALDRAKGYLISIVKGVLDKRAAGDIQKMADGMVKLLID